MSRNINCGNKSYVYVRKEHLPIRMNGEYIWPTMNMSWAFIQKKGEVESLGGGGMERDEDEEVLSGRSTQVCV